ncbi:MAG TPA: hypothetical protein VFY16_07175 [Gemmatimonadaceae bacterium]|nr:hypothetical protein [Gemmatimonadaceae bacterium]
MSPRSIDAAPCPHELRPGMSVCLHCRHNARTALLARRRHQFGTAGLVALTLAVLGMAGGAWASASRPAETRLLSTDAPAAPTAAPAARPVPVAPAPVIGEGRTELGEGMFALRHGDSVTVNFDTELGRTRRPEKFEATVRATLPRVHGVTGTRALAGAPEGSIASAGDLLTVLPARGARLAADDGWSLVVTPVTRPGRDGPIVVAYVATVTR